MLYLLLDAQQHMQCEYYALVLKVMEWLNDLINRPKYSFFKQTQINDFC